MASYNKTILMGNLTRDPEIRVTGGGMSVGSFTLAINNQSKDKESVSYIDCVAFGKTAEFAKDYLEKGMPILIEGHLQQNRWEQEGQKRSKIEVIVDKMTFVGSKKSENQRPANNHEESYAGAGVGSFVFDDSDIPF